MDAEQMAVVTRAEKMLADPATYEATLRQVALERLVIRARADIMNEAQQRIDDKRRENEARALGLVQARFDCAPVGMAAHVDFYRNVLGWQLIPVRKIDGKLLPVGSACGKTGEHILAAAEEIGEGVEAKMRKGDLLAVNIPASRVCVLTVERGADAEYEAIRAHFHVPATLAWTGPDGVTSFAYAGGRVPDWTDHMELGDGVRLTTTGWSVLPPSQGVEWTVTPKMFFKSLNGTTTKGIPELSSEAVTLVRDLRRATPETCRRYVAMILQNAAECDAAGTKGRSKN